MIAETFPPFINLRKLKIHFINLSRELVSSKNTSSLLNPINSKASKPAGAVIKQILLFGNFFLACLIAG